MKTVIQVLREKVTHYQAQKNYWHNEFMILKREFDSDKKHYAVLEKTNEQYVKIISAYIETDQNLLKNIQSLLEGGKAVSALEVLNNHFKK